MGLPNCPTCPNPMPRPAGREIIPLMRAINSPKATRYIADGDRLTIKRAVMRTNPLIYGYTA